MSIPSSIKGDERPWTEWTSDGIDLQHDGSFDGILPIGEYELQAHAKGRPSSLHPIIAASQGISDVVLTVVQQPGTWT